MAHFNSPEEHFDHLIDVEMRDAASAREISGYVPELSEEESTASAIAARSGSVALDGFLADGQAEHDELDEKYGRVICGNCNRPGCKGCGRS